MASIHQASSALRARGRRPGRTEPRPQCAAPILVGLALLLLGLAGPVRAEPPDRVTVGDRELVLSGQGTRSRWLMDLYRLSLYLPKGTDGLDAIRSPETPKLFRAEVVYDGFMSSDEIPEDWQHELAPATTTQEMTRIEQAYGGLSAGDVVRLSYAPGAGSTLSFNGEPVVQSSGHELMGAGLAIWLGDEPISDDLKEAVLAPLRGD